MTQERWSGGRLGRVVGPGEQGQVPNVFCRHPQLSCWRAGWGVQRDPGQVGCWPQQAGDGPATTSLSSHLGAGPRPPRTSPASPASVPSPGGQGGRQRRRLVVPVSSKATGPVGRESHRLAPRPPRGGPARPPVPSQLWLGGGPATKPAPCGGCGLRGARQCARGAAPPHTPVLPVAFLSVQRGRKPAAARQAAAAVSTGRTEPLATSWSPAHRGVRVAGGRSGVLPSPPAWGPNVQPGHWTPHPH